MSTQSLFSQLFRLSKHSLIYGFGAVVSQFIGFLLIPLYTRYLTPADYGVLEIFTSSLSVLSILLPLGVIGGLAMSYYERDNEESRKTALSSAWLYLTAGSLCLIILLEATAGTFSSLAFGSEQYTLYFRVIFLAAFFDASISLALLVLRVREKSVNYVVIVLARLLISVGLTIFFVVALQKGVLGILLSQLITAGLIYLFMIPRLIKVTGFRFSATKLRGMVSYGIPFIPSNLASWIMTLGDRYFLLFLSTSTELGLYSMGYKFGMVVNVLLVAPFMLAWGPFFWSVAKMKNAKSIYSSIFTYFILVGMFVALTVSILSKEILAIMATPQFYDAYKVVPMIAFSYVLLGCFSILAVGIGIEKKTKYIPLITGIGAAVNLGLNYLFIPKYGMMGAALATVISYILLPVGSFLISRRYYTIRYEWVRVVKICSAAGLVYAGSVFITSDSAIVAGVIKLIILLFYPVLLYFFKFYQPEEIKKGKEIMKAAPGYVRRRLGR